MCVQLKKLMPLFSWSSYSRLVGGEGEDVGEEEAKARVADRNNTRKM